jgi:hypothetical protein
MLLRTFGWLMVVAVWLPACLFGRCAGNHGNFKPAWGRSFVKAAYGNAPWPEALPLHQVRLATLPLPTTKGVGWDLDSEIADSATVTRVSPRMADVAIRLRATTQTWQFEHRTALPPRAPCAG